MPPSGKTFPPSHPLKAKRGFAPWHDAQARPIVQFERITKKFGDILAVDDVSLDIYARELFCLLGPSGCGKTTLMRLLAGFEQPNSGLIKLDGVDIAGVPPYRRPVNMMFQSYALFPHMSVAGNVAFGLKQEGMPRKEIQTRVDEMLDLVQMRSFADRRPHQLSGGQKQRVALARALAKRPKVLLLDEPLAALDKKLREETQFELMELQSELGITFIMVTHDQDEAMTMADRIAVMEQGKLSQVGVPREIYEAPASRSVAAFIGDVSLIEGKVIRLEGNLAVISSPALTEELKVAGSAEPGTEIAIALRPEKVRFLNPGEAGAINRLSGTIWDIGYLGEWTTYRVKLSNGTIIRLARANSLRNDPTAPSWDDSVTLTFAPDAAILLSR